MNRRRIGRFELSRSESTHRRRVAMRFVTGVLRLNIGAVATLHAFAVGTHQERSGEVTVVDDRVWIFRPSVD